MMLFAPPLLQQAENMLKQLRAQHLTLATAESCTGGLVSALLTEISGSSDVLTHGYVTYANAAKISMLQVSATLIETHGAVSEEVARAMAEGAQKISGARIAVAITGIAGPNGGTATKPVGLVHIACARDGLPTLHVAQQFSGDRSTVRLQAVAASLELVGRQLSSVSS
jgi:nicotinamide-nucleotide amidase